MYIIHYIIYYILKLYYICDVYVLYNLLLGHQENRILAVCTLYFASVYECISMLLYSHPTMAHL